MGERRGRRTAELPKYWKVEEPATQVVPPQSPTVKVELVSRRIPVAWQFHE